MPRTVYLNGQFLPHDQAKLDLEDRGMLFGDGVYEVVRYYGGRPFAMPAHLDRLHANLRAIRIELTDDLRRMDAISDELMRRNAMHDGTAYWQVTRGSGPRRHAFPDAVKPTVMMFTAALPPLDRAADPKALTAILVEDRRWADCWIKSTMLLPNILARQQALDAGADDAIFHRGDIITEGSATSVFMVREGELWTHPLDGAILPSVTRAVLIDLARAEGRVVHEQPFTRQQLSAAQELLLCGTTTQIAAVTRLNGQAVGSGRIGPVTQSLHRRFVNHVWQSCCR